MKLHVAVGLFAAFACSGLQAQTAIMKANIPFDFHLGKAVMPAGQYDISYSAHLLTLRQNAGGHDAHAALALTTPVSRSQRPSTGLLEFTQYGDTYFFAKVWTPYSQQGGALPKTSREKELARRGGPTPPTAVALRSK